LIQAGASLAYVRDQLGHSSIQVTVDLYGHLVPSANVGWVDGLDSAEPEEQSATPTQQETEEESDESFEVIENYGGPGVSRTRDLRFRKPLLYPSELRGHVDVTHYATSVYRNRGRVLSIIQCPGSVRLRLWNAAFELRHRIADINVNRFDVIRRGGVHIRVDGESVG
jgi:hypothetical protein